MSKKRKKAASAGKQDTAKIKHDDNVIRQDAKVNFVTVTRLGLSNSKTNPMRQPKPKYFIYVGKTAVVAFSYWEIIDAARFGRQGVPINSAINLLTAEQAYLFTQAADEIYNKVALIHQEVMKDYSKTDEFKQLPATDSIKYFIATGGIR